MSSVFQNPEPSNPSRRDDLLLMLLHGGAATNAIATHVVDAFRDSVVDDLIERCVTALGNCCPECDIAIQLIRRRGDVVKGVKS